MSIFRFQIILDLSDFRFQIFKSQISDNFRFQISKLRFQISKLRFQISDNFRFQIIRNLKSESEL
ncbi:MAG: hypothetical protein DMF60_07640 [Acidobacteria bacterium]|nr:MAG: hypothetical protein DMF60_07640 [Acidobacteriota bacterium]